MKTKIEGLVVTKELEPIKIKILFETWKNLAHSYGCVSAFQLIHLYKNYGPEGKIKKNYIDFYTKEMPYYMNHWKNKQKLVYSEEYNNILKNFKEYKNEKIDLIYRQTYPYDITNTENKHVPKCIFYTSEFKEYLTADYFLLNQNQPKDDSSIKNYLKHFNNTFYFTSPSIWSSKGLIKYNVQEEHNRVITHGVDSSIFYKHNDNCLRRKEVRNLYKVLDNDILLISIGAMTKNKGIMLILELMNILVHRVKKTNYKLLLKGTGDLYQSKQFLEMYFEELIKNNIITEEEIANLQNYIIFTDKTLSYSMINDLYNASDLYIAPYLAEGFGLTPLEALSSGLNILVPQTGSTKEYIEKISDNHGDNYIFKVNSNVITLSNGMCQNNINIQDLFNTIISFENKLVNERRNTDKIQIQKNQDNYKNMKMFIEKELSWNKVSELLVNYFNDIIFKTI
jgi:glycosyltransferase involved in cell wall biosynthesis